MHSSQEDDRTTLELTDSAGRSLTIFFTGKEPENRQLAVLAELHKQFHGWKSMQVRSIRYTFTDKDSIEIQIFPQSFADEKNDYMKYLPGHLFFIYKDQLQYSFRLEVNKLFVKIRGYFTEEAELLKKLAAAVKDPQGFIVKRDPEYFVAKFEKLEEELETQKGELFRQKKENERLKAAIAALHNTGWFSGPEAIPEALLARIVELKIQNPQWKRKEIEEQLERDKIDYRSKQVRLVLAVYFSEFE
ncbi:MAG: hypothetical protein N2Z22_01910 [Turneriella sp.]|nr:hypothetical protein [Turneriella sp.]